MDSRLQFVVVFSAVLAVAGPWQAEISGEDKLFPDGLSAVEKDWLLQARVLSGLPLPGSPGAVTTWADAAGAVDGVKDGKYAFHCGLEPNPWWQVDLGKPVAVSRIVVYNRLDYAPGLHNADRLHILASNDGKAWKLIHDNREKHFGGISGAPPLDLRFQPGQVRARYVRLQIPSENPIFFHLDEVEIYGAGDPERNIALRRPADQSSLSQWSTAKVHVPPGKLETYPIVYAIERGRLLAADLREAGVDTKPFERELGEIEMRLKKGSLDMKGDPQRELYLKARRVVRRLAFSNPLLEMEKLLFVKRFTQETYPDVCLNHMPWVSRPGGDLCILSNPFSQENPGEGEVRTIINGRLGPGHVHGMDLWYGGSRVVFGYAKAKSNEPPKGWLDRRTNYDLRRSEEPIHIFEIQIDGTGLRQLTDGEWSDLDPTYLPSGNIAFVSERCGYSLQCNELDKDETSCNLYIMKPDGSSIRRLSVTKDGDYLPHTLADGTIGYTRWEYQERGWAHIQSIWFVRPDGTGADALFKQHLNEPWALEEARSIPGSRKLVAIATGHHTLPAGPVCVVDPAVGMNDAAGIAIVTPGVRPPEGGMSGTPVGEGGVTDRGGLYMNPWPLSEKYFLASFSYSSKQTEPAGFALYLIDVFGTKELIYRDREISSFLPIPLRPRQKPPVLPDVTDAEIPYAVCTVSDVGFGVPGIRQEEIRYIRIAQRIAWPYDNIHGGQRYAEKAHPNNWTPCRILGTVPVEKDGSAHFRVPVDTPLYFQILDENFMELRRMRSFISFQPGEVRGCVGCHETRAVAAASKTIPAALQKEPSDPAPPPWGDRPISFLRDVQPILNRNCAGCHGGLKPAGGLDLTAGLTAMHNTAFDTIIRHRLVSWSDVQGDARITLPLEFGSHRSKMVEVLSKEEHQERVKLSEDDRLRLVTWIDANAPYHDVFINKRPVKKPYDLAADRNLAGRILAVHGRRCAPCHKVEEVSRLSWIDIHEPSRSLFLTAPLSKEAGGKAACEQLTYENSGDPDYQAVLQDIRAAVDQLWEYPRRDVAAFVRQGI